jgi:hypothetical protein
MELKSMFITFYHYTLKYITLKMKKSNKKRFLIFLKIQNENIIYKLHLDV